MSEHVQFLILYIVGGLLLFELLLFNLIVPLISYLRRKHSPVRTVRAEVVLADQRETAVLPWWLRPALPRSHYTSTYIPSYDVEDLGKSFTYWITFEIGKSRLEFQVREKEYSEFQPGDCGELVYQFDRVLTFTRERSDEENAVGESE